MVRKRVGISPSHEGRDLLGVVPAIAVASALNDQQITPESGELLKGQAGFFEGVGNVAAVDQVHGHQ